MPQFELNAPHETAHPYYGLSTFAKGYVEAMFFTNGDTGDSREFLLNEWGVEALTNAAVADIARDCEAFWKANEADLTAAIADAAHCGYDEERAGNDFWYSRQGHGVGYADRGDADYFESLQEAARKFGEAYVDAYRRKIHHR